MTLSGQTPDPEQSNLRRAIVRGTYDYGQEIILRNRTLNEIPGVHVIVPLRIAGTRPPCTSTAAGSLTRWQAPEQRKEFQQAAGEVEGARYLAPQRSSQQPSLTRRPTA